MIDEVIFLEISRDVPSSGTDHKCTHWVNMLKRPTDKYGHYQWIISMDRFSCGGIRSDATPQEKKIYRAGWNWSPTALYINKHSEKEFIEDSKRTDESIRRTLEKYPPKEGEIREPWISDLDLPRIRHENIFAFYRHIGFDWKRKRYLKNGEFFLADYA